VSARHLTALQKYAALRRLGYAKHRSGYSPSAVFCSATFFCARKNASHFSLSGAKKRHLQGGRYAPVAQYILGLDLN